MSKHDPVPAPPAPTPLTSPTTMLWILLILTGLLMLFSSIMWILGNDTLAAGSGLGAIGLVSDIARRLMPSGNTAPPAPVDPPPLPMRPNEGA